MQLDGFREAINGEPGRDFIPFGPHLNQAYLDYSVSVVQSRAIPDVRDGLKPVHRRILYAMDKLGLNPTAYHKKSARVVGDVIGKYHPHGDQAVYEAMVLMAQNFSLRHPLIDGQGNWGSVDGDSAAAMRYTECRMSGYARLLLEEIDKGTVDFRLNYDGNDLEPVCLPARVPMVLLNDQMGIAVGMASDLPAHNLGEVVQAAVAMYRNPAITLDEVLTHIKGPDFPCGGQVTNTRAEIAEIYATGRGMLTVRARYEVKKDADGGWYLVFNELPPKISPEQVLLEFEAISNPQPKAKAAKGGSPASITPEQKAQKQLMLSRVSEVSNGAGNDTGPVYLEVYPKSNRQKPEDLAAYLFSVTSLESRVKVNSNLINLAGLPMQMGLVEILRDWTTFRFDTVTRRCNHRLEKVEARLHILEGFQKILLDIDQVIKVIRASDNDKEAKAALMSRWALSEIQADRILEIKLRQLTRLDELAIRKEFDGLEKEKKQLIKLLSNRDAMTALIISELEGDSAKYATPRRTVIEVAASAVFEEPVIDEPVTIILSRKGWLRARSGHGLDLAGLAFKDGDGLHTIVETRTTKPLYILDANGRFYTVAASAIPGGRGDGAPITSLIEIQDKAKLVAIFTAEPKDKVLLASTIGYGFVTEVENLHARNKAGKAVLNADTGAALAPILIKPEMTRLVVMNSTGYMLCFALEEIGEYPKGKGNKLIGLKKGEEVVHLAAFAEEFSLKAKRGKEDLTFTPKLVTEYTRKRGSRGRLVPRNVEVPTLAEKAAGLRAVQDELFG